MNQKEFDIFVKLFLILGSFISSRFAQIRSARP